jgi:hypothetical protein
MRIPKRAIALLAMSAIPATAFALAAASPAEAAANCSGVGSSVNGTTFNGCVNASAGLNFRSHSGGGNVTWNDPPIMTAPYGTRVWIDCYFTGPPVTGPYGTTDIWDDVAGYIEPGQSIVTVFSSPGTFAVASDAWIYTGSNNPVVKHC